MQNVDDANIEFSSLLNPGMGKEAFRAEGDFLVRVLVDLISHCRAQLGRLEG
jgi:hypothetical protein